MRTTKIMDHDGGVKTQTVEMEKYDHSIDINLPNGASVHVTQHAYMGEEHEKHYTVSLFDRDGTKSEVIHFDMDKENERATTLKEWSR